MRLQRRSFIQALALSSVGLMPLARATTNQQPSSFGSVIGTCRLDQDHYGVSSVDLTGRVEWQFPLPARGHEVALHPSRAIGVAIARRPERYLVMFNALSGEVLTQYDVEPSLKLNGHAVWHGDNLIVSGSDTAESTMQLLRFAFNNSANQLSLVEQRGYELLGPHQMVLKNNTLWVAIGGLKTAGREVLNKQSVESGLASISPDNLELINYVSSPEASVSLRHLCASNQGDIYIAGQYQLDVSQSPALLFKLNNNQLTPFQIEPDFWPRVKGYIGSIACTDTSIVATSPRGHWLGEFDMNTLSLQEQLLSMDICALANSPVGPIAGTGTGNLHLAEQRINSHVRWDNHFSYRPS
ncbi:DUF1513 domain-containing protein [Reinekea thalattae]|uniref:DUF1513 domain-containing protein n=1 Tax=Reinekea thalattae TaxID=2593301 RepID=A0A5C8Z4E6_9GAMM|nr:DUF1513 domain-containing protein [Reinekea thalattae]TXR52068.1 DUF1513 domain-containing protein [Reinekea thalattae]